MFEFRLKYLLKFVPKGPIDKISALVQILVWRRPGEKPFFNQCCLAHWGRDKMADISQRTLSKAFSWMKIYALRLIFHRSLFLRVQLIPALVQIMAWRRPDDRPLSETIMVSLLMHVCVTRPQWLSYTHNALYLNNLHGLVYFDQQGAYWTPPKQHVNINRDNITLN